MSNGKKGDWKDAAPGAAAKPGEVNRRRGLPAYLGGAVLPRRETQPPAPEDRDIAQAAARRQPDGSRDNGACPSPRPSAGAPPASPGGPRPRTGKSLRAFPDGPGRIPCACESTCREHRTSGTGTSEETAGPENTHAHATHGCPASKRIKRI